MVETSFDVDWIEYLPESDFAAYKSGESDDLWTWDYWVTVSVDVPDEFKDKDYTWTEDLIRDSLKTHISQRLGEPVVVVDFTAFYAGTKDPLRGNYEDFQSDYYKKGGKFEDEYIIGRRIPRKKQVSAKRVFVVSSVDYDTGQIDDLDLPQDFTLTLDIDEIGDTTDMQEIADYLVEDISDKTGWLVDGFYFQEKMPDGTLVDLDAEAHDSKPVGHYDWFRIFVQSDAMGDEASGWYDGTDFETASRDFDEYAQGWDKVQLVGYYLDDDEEQEEDVIRLFVSGNKYDAEEYDHVKAMREFVGWLKKNNLEPSDVLGFTPDGHVILKPKTQRANYKPDMMFSAEGKCDMFCNGKNDRVKGSLACEPCLKEWGERMEKNKDVQREYNPPEDYYRAEDLEFTDWANQESKSHGKVSLKEWADHEIKKHGGKMSFQDWAKHEDKSHIRRYGAEDCEYCGTKEEEELTEIREDSWDGPKVLVCDRCLDIAMYGAEEGQPCPTCSSCSHKFHLRDTTIHDEEVWVDVECEKCRLQAGGYADLEMDYEPATLEYNRTALNIVECPNCHQGFTLNAENWGGDPTGKLATALRKARIKAKKPRKPLKIEKLDAETSGQWEIGEQLEEAQMNAEDSHYMKDFARISRDWKTGGPNMDAWTYQKLKSLIEEMEWELSETEEFYQQMRIHFDTAWEQLKQCDSRLKEANAAMKGYQSEEEKEKCPSCLEVTFLDGDVCDDCTYCEYCEEYHPDEVTQICYENAYHKHYDGPDTDHEDYMEAEGKGRKKISGALSDPFDELSLDSGGTKKVLVGVGLGLIALIGYNKWK